MCGESGPNGIADSQETFLFRLFKVSSEKVLDELEETAAVRPLREARLQLKELFGFLAKGASVGLAADRFSQVLTEKVRGYIEVCREISAAYGICHDRFIIVDRKEIFWSSREGVLSHRRKMFITFAAVGW